jgi:3-isopropylmalate dehydratase small subunit
MAIAPIEGSAAVFGDHVSADAVLPARHSFLPLAQMAEQVLMDLGEVANRKVRDHSIIVAGEAFGYGTGRESPSRALRAAGVRAVIARSFSRLFFRNAINNGIVVIQCPALVAMGPQDGDTIRILLDEGTITWKGQSFTVAPMGGVVSEIVAAGSLVEYGRQVLTRDRGQS